MGLLFCAAPMLFLAVFLIVSACKQADPDGPHSQKRAEVMLTFGILIPIAAAVATWITLPSFMPSRHLATIAERAAPLIAATDAFEARHGTPPKKLEDLVPNDLAQIPATGTPTFGAFIYLPRLSSTSFHWELIVLLDSPFSTSHLQRFHFDSTDRVWSYRNG